MDSIIAITFNHKIINEKNYKSCTNKNLLKIITKPKYYIRPPSFNELEKLISTLYTNKDKDNTKTKIIGLCPSGERIEINDEETYKNNISIFIVLNLRKKKLLLPDINTKGLFHTENNYLDNLRHSLNITNIKPKKIENETFSNFRKSINSEIEKTKNSLIDNFMRKDSNEMLKLEKSVSDIIEKIEIKNKMNINNLRQSLTIFKKNVVKKQNSLIQSIRLNSKKIEKAIETANLQKDSDNEKENGKENVEEDEQEDNMDVNDIKVKQSIIDAQEFFDNIEEVNEEKIDENDEEKIIFAFIEKKINVEQLEYEIKEKSQIIHVKNIKIKNIGLKEYDLSHFNWLKDKNSDEDINFYQESANEEFKNELHFTSTEICKSEEEKNNLDLNLIIDKPTVGKKYTMYISIFNINKKEVSSEEPLEISVEIKIDIKQKIKKILNFVKEKKYLEFISEKEIMDIIEKKITTEDFQIIEFIENEIKTLKKVKVFDLINKFAGKINFKNINDELIEEKIEKLNFNEDKIKEWIKSKIEEYEQEEALAVGNYIQQEDENEHQVIVLNEEKMEEIYNEIESFYIVSSFLSKELIFQKIIDLKGNIEDIRDWVEEMM